MNDYFQQTMTKTTKLCLLQTTSDYTFNSKQLSLSLSLALLYFLCQLKIFDWQTVHQCIANSVGELTGLLSNGYCLAQTHSKVTLELLEQYLCLTFLSFLCRKNLRQAAVRLFFLLTSCSLTHLVTSIVRVTHFTFTNSSPKGFSFPCFAFFGLRRCVLLSKHIKGGPAATEQHQSPSVLQLKQLAYYNRICTSIFLPQCSIFQILSLPCFSSHHAEGECHTFTFTNSS